MKERKEIRHMVGLVLLAVLVTLLWASGGRGQVPVSSTENTKENARNAAGFKKFLDQVQVYLELRKSIQSSLPRLKPTPNPETITSHQQALAQKIREARPHAKHGDIFSTEGEEAFRRVVHEEFHGPHGHHARTTIEQGSPLKSIHLHVNDSYPDGVPFTTVPPTLLLKFPKLPDQIAYRIVVRDLILLDAEANVVIDKISDIFPETM
ncbi:MAG TPA: hypothetical protein VIW23_04330 [Candidatus Acidoferrum sp.]